MNIYTCKYICIYIITYPPTPWGHQGEWKSYVLLSEKPALGRPQGPEVLHLPAPTATYRHLRRLVTPPQISMKIIHVLLYVPANIQYFTFNSGQVIMKIINFCNTYKLKRSFPILEEIVVIVNATQIN